MNGQIFIEGVTTTFLKDGLYKLDSAQAVVPMQSFITELVPSVQVTCCNFTPKEVESDSLTINYEDKSNVLYTDVAGLQVYKLTEFLNILADKGIFASPSRKTDLSLIQYLGMIGFALDETEIQIPVKKSVFKAPDNSTVDNEYFTYRIRIEKRDKSLYVSRDFTLKTQVILAAKFNDFKTEMEKVYKNDIVTIVMQQ